MSGLNEERKLRALKIASSIIDVTKEYCKAMRADLSFTEKLMLTNNYESRKHLIISQRLNAGGIPSGGEILTVNSGDSLGIQVSNEFLITNAEYHTYFVRAKLWDKIYEGYELVV